MMTNESDVDDMVLVDEEAPSGWVGNLEKICKTGSAMLFYMEVVQKENTQQVSAVCTFCKQKVTSTGTTRLATHLTSKCVFCPREVKEKFRELDANKEKKRKLKDQQATSCKQEQEMRQKEITEKKLEHAKKHEAHALTQSSIRLAMSSASCDAADKSIAKFFYANGIPFSAASPEVDSYYREMVAAIQKAGSTYKPPGRKALGGKLIDECHADMLSHLRGRDPHGATADKFGCTYVSDGCREDVNHTPLINSAYVTANDGGVYLRSVDTSGYTKDADYLAKLMIEDIFEIGPTKVVAVCTDTCNSMKAAWRKVEAHFPWIFTVPCQAHCASLLSKDIGGIPEVARTVKEESMVSGWFLNHHKPLAILRSVTQQLLHKTLELRRAAATRFGSNTLVGQRQMELKNVLQATVVHSEYEKMGYRDEDDTVEEGNGYRTVRESKGGTVKKLILDLDDTDNNSFWSRVRQHVELSLPILKLIRRHDSSAPSVGKVYHGWFEVGESIKTRNTSYAEIASAKFDSRWAYGHCKLFGAAYVLDPEFVGHDQAGNEEVMTDFLDAVEKIGVLMAVKEDMLKGRYQLENDLIPRDANDLPNCFPKTSDKRVQDFCRDVNQQLSLYRGRKGIFARDYIFASAETMPSHLWWEQFAASVPQLQTVAMLVLSQPASASICERINSEYGFVVDKRRNRLKQEKADKLVSLFHNLRLLRKMNKVAYVEPLVGWGDGTIESFGVGDPTHKINCPVE